MLIIVIFEIYISQGSVATKGYSRRTTVSVQDSSESVGGDLFET